MLPLFRRYAFLHAAIRRLSLFIFITLGYHTPRLRLLLISLPLTLSFRHCLDFAAIVIAIITMLICAVFAFLPPRITRDFRAAFFFSLSCRCRHAFAVAAAFAISRSFVYFGHYCHDIFELMLIAFATMMLRHDASRLRATPCHSPLMMILSRHAAKAGAPRTCARSAYSSSAEAHERRGSKYSVRRQSA